MVRRFRAASAALIACTTPQKCPLLSPRSRNHRPPGHASIVMRMGLPSGPEFERSHLFEKGRERLLERRANVNLLLDVECEVLDFGSDCRPYCLL